MRPPTCKACHTWAHLWSFSPSFWFDRSLETGLKTGPRAGSGQGRGSCQSRDACISAATDPLHQPVETWSRAPPHRQMGMGWATAGEPCRDGHRAWPPRLAGLTCLCPAWSGCGPRTGSQVGTVPSTGAWLSSVTWERTLGSLRLPHFRGVSLEILASSGLALGRIGCGVESG